MKVLAMVVAALKGRGPRVFALWVALCLAFAFVFRVWGERPLGEVRSSELTGMAFATGMVVLLGDGAVARWTNARRKGKRRGAKKAG